MIKTPPGIDQELANKLIDVCNNKHGTVAIKALTYTLVAALEACPSDYRPELINSVCGIIADFPYESDTAATEHKQ